MGRSGEAVMDTYRQLVKEDDHARLQLDPPKQPVAIRKEFIARSATTITIKQLDHTWYGLDFTVTKADGSPLFTVDGKPGTMSQRRQFKDNTGLPLFDLCRKWLSKNAWFLELPGGGGSRLLTGVFKSTLGLPKFDIVLKNAVVPKKADEGEDVTIEVRGKDSNYITTHITIDGCKVAQVRRIPVPKEQLYVYSVKGNRPKWEVDVAEGMDLSLVAVIVVILSDFIPRQVVT
ncbi:hypothetical protein VTN96DRAFT_2365 [Rasamsonia emersonii]